MNRFQLALAVSGMVHLGAFVLAGDFWISSPTVLITPGQAKIELVFQKQKPKETPRPLLSESIAIKEEEKKPEPKELIQVVPSVETEGAQYQEVDYASNSPPIYPRLAILRNLQGRMIVWVEVSAQGDPIQVRVEESSGHSILDEAALDAVWKWKFSPARLGKIAMKSQVRIPILFRIIEKQ